MKEDIRIKRARNVSMIFLVIGEILLAVSHNPHIGWICLGVIVTALSMYALLEPAPAEDVEEDDDEEEEEWIVRK